MGESLEDFLLNLHRLSKKLSTTRRNKRTLPPGTRLRCLCKQLKFSLYLYGTRGKRWTVNIGRVYTLAATLEKAQKNADVYNAARSVLISRDGTAHSSDQEASSDSSSVLRVMEDQDPINENLAAVPSTDKTRFYCGYTHRKRKVCPARNGHSLKCGLKRHFQAVCRFIKGKSCTQSTQPLLCGISSEYPQCLEASVTQVTVRNHQVHALTREAKLVS